MKAEIITIGDEILIGQIVDTNSAWIGQELNKIGVKIVQITSVQDEKQHILTALADAETRADLILITGGLGPTKDDITKHTLCEYFGVGLKVNEEVLEMVRSFFEKRNRPLTELNYKQAEVLENCTVFKNYNGTAPCMMIKKQTNTFISMPGVPHEMKALMSDQVIPFIQSEFDLPFIYHKTVLTQGLGESFLAERISSWEDNLIHDNIKLAYLPNLSVVRLRLSVTGKDKEKLIYDVNKHIEGLKAIVGEYIFGYEEFGIDAPNIENVIGEALKEKGFSVATAESCTGGYVSHLITSVAGSSAYYKGSLIVYDYATKEKMLNIPMSLLNEYGAVSEECIKLMAQNGREILDSDYCIATSGIAGPGGGTDAKPVGTIWIAVAHKDGVETKLLKLGNKRDINIKTTAVNALRMLHKLISD